MNNLIILIIICIFCAVAMYVGTTKISVQPASNKDTTVIAVPEIGSIEILNGCGAEGAATKVADYLRANNFDVKYLGNADTWNYPFTMVISRNRNDSVAQQVAGILKTDKIVRIRKNDNTYDVTVVIGPDYGERIQ
jgi:LytR cell envelope-related transcriptional attenuator